MNNSYNRLHGNREKNSMQSGVRSKVHQNMRKTWQPLKYTTKTHNTRVREAQTRTEKVIRRQFVFPEVQNARIGPRDYR